MGIIFTGSRHSIRPSLNLDFANSKALDPRITFSRTSNATYYDGYTTVKAEENLVKYSQDFNNAYWLKEAATVTANSTSAPDGTTTAELLLETTDSGTHKIYGNPPSYNSVTGNSFTVSIYCKSYVSDRYLGLVSQLGGGSRVSVRFDPSTQTLSSVLIVGSEITNVTAGYQDVGNGWYRVYLSGTFSAGNVYIAAAPSNTMTPLDQSYGFSSYSGDVTKGIYLWGAQIEQKDNVSAYTPTTNSLITKYQPALQTAGNNVARFDHNPTTGESLGLLIEESRTNLFTYSEEFDNAVWFKGQTSIIANTILAPDGTLTADKVIPSTVSAGHSIQRTYTTTANTNYTMSVYLKKGEYKYVRLHWGKSGSPYTRIRIIINLDDGSFTNTDSGTPTSITTRSVTDVGNGWYRCSLGGIFDTTSTDGTLVAEILDDSQNVTHTGNDYSGLYFWGAQLEIGSFPTSYIKTTGSQVTRSDDDASITGTNFSDWYNVNNEGSVYLEVTENGVGNNSGAVWFNNGTVNRGFGYRRQNAGADLEFAYRQPDGSYMSAEVSNSLSVGSPDKITLGFSSSTISASINGSSAVTDTDNIYVDVNQLRIGYAQILGSSPYIWCGTIKKLSYYPIKLTDNELQDLSEE